MEAWLIVVPRKNTINQVFHPYPSPTNPTLFGTLFSHHPDILLCVILNEDELFQGFF